jgi:transketolase C-terminal domain/subunit
MRPIYPSFAVFTTRRPYEQIALSIAYPNLPVRLVGFLPGLTTPGGVSHQAIDDLGLMKQLNLLISKNPNSSYPRFVNHVMKIAKGSCVAGMERHVRFKYNPLSKKRSSFIDY